MRRLHAILAGAWSGAVCVLDAARRRKVLVVIEAAFIALLNVAVTVVLSGTPVAPGAGACAVTVGATSVVKLQRESAPSAVPLVSVTAAATVRSEERRVGKECRCRWSPNHYKEKTGN